MTNSDEGMLGCTPANNQYIKVGSGERLQIMKKGCKQCTILQKNGRKPQVILYNVYYVPKLWYNLFSILEALKRGWTIGNKGMHITLSKGQQRIEFDRLFECPTGHLTSVTIKAVDDIRTIASMSRDIKISHEEGNAKLMHVNNETMKRKAHNLGWKLNKNNYKPTCMSCAIGKSKQKNVPKTTQVKADRPGERLFIDISSMKMRSLGGSKFWALIVDDIF